MDDNQPNQTPQDNVTQIPPVVQETVDNPQPTISETPVVENVQPTDSKTGWNNISNSQKTTLAGLAVIIFVGGMATLGIAYQRLYRSKAAPVTPPITSPVTPTPNSTPIGSGTPFTPTPMPTITPRPTLRGTIKPLPTSSPRTIGIPTSNPTPTNR